VTTGNVKRDVRDKSATSAHAVIDTAVSLTTTDHASPVNSTRSTERSVPCHYRTEALRPGTYTVTFRLSGFWTLAREGVELTMGFTANVNGEMAVGALEETMTVAGGAPLVDVQNVGSRENLSREILDTVPTGKTWAGHAALTVGCSRAFGETSAAATATSGRS